MDMTGGEKWLDAQYSVLGSVLISPECAPKVLQETGERDYYGTCRTVYKAIRKLFLDGVEIDPVSVNGLLGGKYTDFLMQLMQVTPTASGIDRYIALCREQAQVNGLRDLARQMAETESPDQLRKLFEQASGLMVSRPTLRITTMAEAMRTFMEDQQGQPNYLTWPIRELNEIVYAEKGDLIVIGGYPSSGKTALALQCMWHMARKYKVGFFSLETSAKKLFARQMASVASLDMGAIKRHALTQADWDRLCTLSQSIVKAEVELIDASGFSVEDIKAVTMMRGYQVIFVDYLQLIQSGGISRVEQVTNVSLAVHTMARTLGVTVIALSQLSRSPKDQKKRLPDLSDLRESGQIEQDADIVFLLSLKDNNDRDGQRVMQISKNKEGTRPDMVLDFDGKHQTFSKAQGNVLSDMVADGKKARRKNQKKAQEPGQMTMLPEDTPVPFGEE